LIALYQNIGSSATGRSNFMSILSNEVVEGLNELNENGLKCAINLINFFKEQEEYNKNTTEERLLKIKEQKKLNIKQQEEKEESDALKRSMEEFKCQRDYEKSLSKNKQKFLAKIRSINIPDDYSMSCEELLMFADIHNNNMIDASGDIFHLGYMQGIREERAKKKERVNR
jgi:hypothetical protein